jgi:hypothetical protein
MTTCHLFKGKSTLKVFDCLILHFIKNHSKGVPKYLLYGMTTYSFNKSTSCYEWSSQQFWPRYEVVIENERKTQKKMETCVWGPFMSPSCKNNTKRRIWLNNSKGDLKWANKHECLYLSSQMTQSWPYIWHTLL